MLPCITPLNVGHLCEQLVTELKHKKVVAAQLADVEQRCDELMKTLCPLIGDGEIKKLVQTHCHVERVDSMKAKYMKAIVDVAMEDFCFSRQMST